MRTLLQDELSERMGRKVRIRHRVRGDRIRWLQMAQTNAEQGLNLQVASNATIRGNLQRLARRLAR